METRDAAQHPTMHRTASATEHDPATNVSSAAVEKPWVTLSLKDPWAIQGDTQEAARPIRRSASVSHLYWEDSGCQRSESVLLFQEWD